MNEVNPSLLVDRMRQEKSEGLELEMRQAMGSMQALLVPSLKEMGPQIVALESAAREWTEIEGEFSKFRSDMEDVCQSAVKPLETLRNLRSKQEDLKSLDRLLSSILKERETLAAIDLAEEQGRFYGAAQLINQLGSHTTNMSPIP